LTQKQVNDALGVMGHDARGTTVKVPAWRTDILHDVDIIEDVAIGHGIDKLVPSVPAIATVGMETKQTRLERTLRQLFVAMGYLEMHTFSLSSPTIQVEHVLQTRRPVEMENSLSAEYSVLRQQLIPGLLEALAKNKHNEYPQMLFEIGSAWTPEEEPRLAFVVCGERAGFTDAKSTLETVMRQLGQQLHLKPYEEKLFISGRGAVFPGGFFGEVHPQILENFDIGFPVVAGEIRLKELFE
jgi:phenylalanyl-tRNA synthetase beta chain